MINSIQEMFFKMFEALRSLLWAGTQSMRWNETEHILLLPYSVPRVIFVPVISNYPSGFHQEKHFCNNLAQCHLFLSDRVSCSLFIHGISKAFGIDADSRLTSSVLSFTRPTIWPCFTQFSILELSHPSLECIPLFWSMINTNWHGCPAYKGISTDYARPILDTFD